MTANDDDEELNAPAKATGKNFTTIPVPTHRKRRNKPQPKHSKPKSNGNKTPGPPPAAEEPTAEGPAPATDNSAAGQGNRGLGLLRDVEPWPEAVDGPSLVQKIVDALRRYLVLHDYAAIAIALWIIYSYVYDLFVCSPILTLTSPVKRCGKTRLLGFTAELVQRPLAASNITPAAIFRAVEAVAPTLLIDEADTFIRGGRELLGILNSGHSRQTAFVMRASGKDNHPEKFSTWCPKVLALIGRAPHTIEDRSIIIPMRRKTKAEKVEPWNLAAAGALEPLRRQAARWATDNPDSVRLAAPQPPDLGSDRAADNWIPLLAIAKVVGGTWPTEALKAANWLSSRLPEDESPVEALLADIQAVFGAKKSEQMSSRDMIRGLSGMEHRPWAEWKHGKPMTAIQLANELRPFGIRPGTIRLKNGKTPKGYKLAEFKDAFERYVAKSDATTGTNNKDKDL